MKNGICDFCKKERLVYKARPLNMTEDFYACKECLINLPLIPMEVTNEDKSEQKGEELPIPSNG